MTRHFTLDEAADLLPEARRRISEVAELTGKLQRLGREVQQAEGEPPDGAVPEVKALQAHIDDKLDWFRENGVQVKGVAPALLDFPAETSDGDEVLLCWLQGEDELAWYHPTDIGFVGRGPISELDLAE